MSNYSDEEFEDQSPILTSGSPSPMHPISGYSKTQEKGEKQQQHAIDEQMDSDEKLYLEEARSDDKNELVEFNRELQWTLMEMKKENDIMRFNLQFALNGGDLNQIEGKDKLKAFLDMTPDQPDAYKTPKIDNQFERDSDFQAASAAVKSFHDESGELRKQVKPIEIKQIITSTKKKQASVLELSAKKTTIVSEKKAEVYVTPQKTNPIDLGIAKAMISEKLSQRSSAKKILSEQEEYIDKNASARSLLMEKLEQMSSSRVERTVFPDKF